MRWLLLLRARLRGLFHRDAIASEIHEELDFHVRMRAEEYERNGATRREAAQRARRRVGNLALLQDRGYDVRGGGLIETVLQDVRYGLRLLAKQRGFSLVAILTLALGIGLSTALVSVIDAAILHPLPYSHPEELVNITIDTPQSGGKSYRLGPSLADVSAIAADGRVFSSIGVWRHSWESPITDDPEPERLSALEVNDGYLGMYGVAPLAGRGINADDMRQGAPAVIVLDYRYWQKRYNGSRDAIGQTVRFDQGSAIIVGVMPDSFNRDVAIWRPLVATKDLLKSRGMGTSTEGRLRTGLSVDDGQRELTEFLARQPGAKAGQKADLRSIFAATVASHTTMVTVLSGAVAAILLIACVNVAGLLIARGATRIPELAVRASIGASRGRLVRQLLTESVVLAVIGGGLGMLLAWWSLGTLVANIPMSLSVTPALNLRVLAFCAGLSLTTGVLFGIAPALRLSRVRVSDALARGAKRAGSAFSRRSGQVLIAAEIALAVVLLAGSGLMLRSLSRLLSVDLGFDPQSFMTVEVQTVDPAPATIHRYYPALLDSIRALPGVAAAGAINHLPLMGTSMETFGEVNGREVEFAVRTVLPGYFEAAGLALRKGRFPAETDRAPGRQVVVVNEQAAKQLFKNEVFDGSFKMFDKITDVIGVVGDIRFDGPIRESGPEVYEVLAPNDPEPPRSLVVVVRPTSGAGPLTEQLKKAASTVGPRVLIDRVRNGREWFTDYAITPRKRTVLLTLLGGLGLVLALVGVFGMTAYAVTRRTQEIGVRMAFGARPSDVVRTMVRDAAIPVSIGLATGIGGAVWATRAISTFLFQTTPRDPGAFAGAVFALGLAACLAAWIPARRAARVDPVQALRAE